MGKSKKKAEAEAAAAAEAEAAAAEAATQAAAEKAAAEEAEVERLKAEQERIRVENERLVSEDRAEKEQLAMKLQAVHRGRAARRAARDVAMQRHEDCEVRQKTHARTSAVEDDVFGDDLFENKDKDYSSADDNVVAGRSLFLFGEESGVRHTFNDFLDHKFTSAFLLCCIMVNVVILSVETPTSTFDDDTKSMLGTVDLVLSIIFSCKRTSFSHSLKHRASLTDECWCFFRPQSRW